MIIDEHSPEWYILEITDQVEEKFDIKGFDDRRFLYDLVSEVVGRFANELSCKYETENEDYIQEINASNSDRVQRFVEDNLPNLIEEAIEDGDKFDMNDKVNDFAIDCSNEVE